MLLAVDIGNTNIVLGVYQKKDLIIQERIKTKLALDKEEFKERISCLFSQNKEKINIKQIILSSVVPSLKEIAVSGFQEIFSRPPLYLKIEDLKEIIKIEYPSPSEIGVDRIVSAIAAKELYGFPAIIVDLGTAITFDVLSEKGAYLGGAITPGLEISMVTLFERAALLPKAKIIKTEKIMGMDTVSSMQSGVYFGFRYLIEGIIKKIQDELNMKALIVITGGWAEIYRGEIRADFIDPCLILEGLRIIAEKN
ncbi:type III pantothenate kinase [bacterium]|nr:type III pantothenate kinase [bacterium]MBU1153530.1 type III pantothenate kinase [bacterium]MBU1782388.1 type III pantothenate kinase [bacterium]MBU2600113.1 type III pantothenate kinase [bacterium]